MCLNQVNSRDRLQSLSTVFECCIYGSIYYGLSLWGTCPPDLSDSARSLDEIPDFHINEYMFLWDKNIWEVIKTIETYSSCQRLSNEASEHPMWSRFGKCNTTTLLLLLHTCLRRTCGATLWTSPKLQGNRHQPDIISTKNHTEYINADKPLLISFFSMYRSLFAQWISIRGMWTDFKGVGVESHLWLIVLQGYPSSVQSDYEWGLQLNLFKLSLVPKWLWDWRVPHQEIFLIFCSWLLW